MTFSTQFHTKAVRKGKKLALTGQIKGCFINSENNQMEIKEK